MLELLLLLQEALLLLLLVSLQRGPSPLALQPPAAMQALALTPPKVLLLLPLPERT